MPTLLWEADMETSDWSQWLGPAVYPGGAHEVAGTGTIASTDPTHAHSGSQALKMTVGAAAGAGRMRRWQEPRAYQAFDATTWVYLGNDFRLTANGPTDGDRYVSLMDFWTTDSAGVKHVAWSIRLVDALSSGTGTSRPVFGLVWDPENVGMQGPFAGSPASASLLFPATGLTTSGGTATVPSAPLNVVAAGGDTTATITWSDPASDGSPSGGSAAPPIGSWFKIRAEIIQSTHSIQDVPRFDGSVTFWVDFGAGEQQAATVTACRTGLPDDTYNQWRGSCELTVGLTTDGIDAPLAAWFDDQSIAINDVADLTPVVQILGIQPQTPGHIAASQEQNDFLTWWKHPDGGRFYLPGDFVNRFEIGNPGGVAPLDETGLIPAALLPTGGGGPGGPDVEYIGDPPDLLGPYHGVFCVAHGTTTLDAWTPDGTTFPTLFLPTDVGCLISSDPIIVRGTRVLTVTPDGKHATLSRPTQGSSTLVGVHVGAWATLPTGYALRSNGDFVGHSAYRLSTDPLTADAFYTVARFTEVDHFYDSAMNSQAGTLVPGPRGLHQTEGTIMFGPNMIPYDAAGGPFLNSSIQYVGQAGFDVAPGGLITGVCDSGAIEAGSSGHTFSINLAAGHVANKLVTSFGGGTALVGEVIDFQSIDFFQVTQGGILGRGAETHVGRWEGFQASGPGLNNSRLDRAIGFDVGQAAYRTITGVSGTAGSDILTTAAAAFFPEDVGAAVSIRDSWDASVSYNVGDGVFMFGKAWTARVANTNSAPPNSTAGNATWQYVAPTPIRRFIRNVAGTSLVQLNVPMPITFSGGRFLMADYVLDPIGGQVWSATATYQPGDIVQHLNRSFRQSSTGPSTADLPTPTWAVNVTYNAGAVVQWDDLLGVRHQFQSIGSGNLGNTPRAFWDATVTYAAGDRVSYPASPNNNTLHLWQSVQNANTNNSPTTGPAGFWNDLGAAAWADQGAAGLIWTDFANVPKAAGLRSASPIALTHAGQQTVSAIELAAPVSGVNYITAVAPVTLASPCIDISNVIEGAVVTFVNVGANPITFQGGGVFVTPGNRDLVLGPSESLTAHYLNTIFGPLWELLCTTAGGQGGGGTGSLAIVTDGTFVTPYDTTQGIGAFGVQAYSVPGTFIFQFAQGTKGAPTAALNANGLGQILWQGYNSATNAFTGPGSPGYVVGASIGAAAMQDLSAAHARGTKLTFSTAGYNGSGWLNTVTYQPGDFVFRDVIAGAGTESHVFRAIVASGPGAFGPVDPQNLVASKSYWADYGLLQANSVQVEINPDGRMNVFDGISLINQHSFFYPPTLAQGTPLWVVHNETLDYVDNSFGVIGPRSNVPYDSPWAARYVHPTGTSGSNSITVSSPEFFAQDIDKNALVQGLGVQAGTTIVSVFGGTGVNHSQTAILSLPLTTTLNGAVPIQIVHGFPFAMHGPRAIVTTEGVTQYNQDAGGAGGTVIFQAFNVFKNKPGRDTAIGAAALFNISPQFLADNGVVTIGAATPVFAPDLPSWYTATYSSRQMFGFCDDPMWIAINGGQISAASSWNVGFWTLPMFVGNVHMGRRIDYQARELFYVTDGNGVRPTVDEHVGVLIEPFSAAVVNVGLENWSTTVYPPGPTQHLTSGSVISALSTIAFVDSGSGANVTLTATSPITNQTATAADGQVLTIVNVDATRSVTFGGSGTLIIPNASPITLAPSESVTLMQHTASNVSVWIMVNLSASTFPGTRYSTGGFFVAGTFWGFNSSGGAVFNTLTVLNQTYNTAVLSMSTAPPTGAPGPTNDSPNETLYQWAGKTVNNQLQTLGAFSVTAHKSYLVEAKYVGHRTDGSTDQGAVFTQTALVGSFAGTNATVSGSANPVSINPAMTGASVTTGGAGITAAGSTVSIKVLGPTTGTVVWHVHVRAYPVGS